MTRNYIGLKLSLCFMSIFILLNTSKTQAEDFSVQDVKPLLNWKNIGPNLAGRSLAVGGSSLRVNEYYFGATGGGLWKTTNGGTDWFPVTDGQINAASVGAIGVCQSNPDILYIGTGEGQFRGTMSMGDGVYGSTDGGKNWSYLGLNSKTGQTAISRIRIDPENCQRIYVSVMGDPWGANAERGIYRSVNGGKKWKKILYKNDETGAADLNIDPHNPKIIFATLWDMERKPWVANSGGPDSGLYRSKDGGDNWQKITKKLPLSKGRIGKIGVAVSGADSNRIYAIVEHEHGGLFRSDNGGDSWVHINKSRTLIDRAEYYIRVAADPTDKDIVYVLVGSGFYKSIDGGLTFKAIKVPHGDNHDLWIDPQNNSRMIQSNDGGANVTVDGGKSWTAQDYPTAQMYHVTTTNEFPFYVCGAQQDRTSKCVPMDGKGEYWYLSGAGEQGYIVTDEKTPHIQIGGAQRGWMKRLNRKTGQLKAIDIWPSSKQGVSPKAVQERFQWTFPIVLSPKEPGIIYAASQYVWRSEDLGDSWVKISPDLTYADPKTIIGEQSVIPNQNSQDYYATIFALSVSPFNKNIIWSGSDDGLIHITLNGGKSWKNITPPDLPKFSKVTSLQASQHHKGKAYIVAERYKLQDLAPYIYKTENYGKSWVKVISGIDPQDYGRMLIEDPQQSGLLFLGTEHGPYVSLNDGEKWQKLGLNLPDVQVSDLTVRNNSLVVATYGRSFWVLDDISILRNIAGKGLVKDSGLLPVADVIRSLARPTEFYKKRTVEGVNKVKFNYSLLKPAQKVTLTLKNAKGGIIRRFSNKDIQRKIKLDIMGRATNGQGWSSVIYPLKNVAGLHTAFWDLRYPAHKEFEGLRIRGGSTNGSLVPPGKYKAELNIDGVISKQVFTVNIDPRLKDVPNKDFQAQAKLAKEIHSQLGRAINGVKDIRALRQKMRSSGQNDTNILSALTALEEEIYQTKARSPSGILQYGGVKLINKLAILQHRTVEGSDGKPTAQSYQVLKMLEKQLSHALAKVEKLKLSVK